MKRSWDMRIAMTPLGKIPTRAKNKGVRRNPAKSLETLSATALRARLATADKKWSAAQSKVIAAGYGRSTYSDMRAMSPIPTTVRAYLAAHDAEYELRAEMQRRKTYHGGEGPISRKNPGHRDEYAYHRSVTADLKKAEELLYDFSGSRGTKELTAKVRPIRVGLTVGKLSGVMYEADRGDGPHQYFHKFKKSSRPLLIADHDGSQLGIVGGQFRFTERGIVDE